MSRASQRQTLKVSDYTTVYSDYSLIIPAVSTLTLSQRALLIKCCQAQRLPHFIDESDTLSALLLKSLPFQHQGEDYPLNDFFNLFPVPDCPPEFVFPILLDILRGTPFADITEIHNARDASWSTEISLCEDTRSPDPDLNFDIFFFHNEDNILHPHLPPIPFHFLLQIRNRMMSFRRKIADSLLYSRYTHKNMSRSTRREAETIGLDLEDVPIFGQDDWIRLYHDRGIKLGGVCEMRQRFYPSSAKPRTYFAMGGEVYDHCRFISDLFINMADTLIPTNRRWKLELFQLEPTSMTAEPQEYYQVYDLSSFTSNYTNQRKLVDTLRRFFDGVPVVIVDEHSGPIEVDLGHLLEDYIETCAVCPKVSYERCGYSNEGIYPHGAGSLLGIFGNMPIATLAHCFTMFTVSPSEYQMCVAGDDAIFKTDGTNSWDSWRAIELVGRCAQDKTFESSEDSCIFLKRPLLSELGRLSLAPSIIPPCVASCFLTLDDSHMDTRYRNFGRDMTVWERISVIGSDLLRFLSSVYLLRRRDLHYNVPISICIGFSKLVYRYTGVHPAMSLPSSGRYLWPASPDSYEFWDIHPYHMLLLYCSPSQGRVCRHESILLPQGSFVEGRQFMSNSSRSLQLAKALGYIDMEEDHEVLEERDLVLRWLKIYRVVPDDLPPKVYQIVVIKPLPEWLTSLIES